MKSEGDSYSNRCRVMKAYAIACRNERTIKARVCKWDERPTCESLVYFLDGEYPFIVRGDAASASRRGFRGEERVYTVTHYHRRV